MKRIVWHLLIIISLALLHDQNIFCQNRWSKSYFGNKDTPVNFIIEAYDKGNLMVGKYGANYSKYNWLMKTDINGEIIWDKTIGDGENAIVFVDMAEDQAGNIYLAGSTLTYEPLGDPLIFKVNPCGEKEWCKVFFTDNDHDFSSCITLTPDDDIVIVLMFTNPEPWTDRICLAKLTPSGEILWRECYTSADTSQRNEITYDIICTPDDGFLITGMCYYEDPTEPNHWIPHPYLLKVDSAGTYEWESVVFKETNLDGGAAFTTVVSPDSLYYYSSISHYKYGAEEDLSLPALVKIDLAGNVISVYDIIDGTKYGKLSYAQFLNDSTLAASAGWGNSDADLWSRAVIIDTLGNLLNSTVLMQDIYTSILQVAYDGKLVYASNTYQNNQFDFYLTKLNQNLEDDTLYTFPFTYDSLCSYQIESDTIVQDDCELIVGIEEEEETGGKGEEEIRGELKIWPNPCRGMLNVECLMLNEGKNCELIIYDILGRPAQVTVISSPLEGGGREGGWRLDVSALPPGVYFISILQDGRRVAGGKFVVSR